MSLPPAVDAITSSTASQTNGVKGDEDVILVNGFPGGDDVKPSVNTAQSVTIPQVNGQHPPEAIGTTSQGLNSTQTGNDNGLDVKQEIPPSQNAASSSFINAEAGPSTHPSSVSQPTASIEPEQPPQWSVEMNRKKRKWASQGYDEVEIQSRERTLMKYQLALQQDQYATLYPSAPTAFTSYDDVIGRLVPYHIWQIHDEELEGYEGNPEKVQLRQAQEDKEMNSLYDAVRGIQDRYTSLRRREGKHPSDVASMISLIHSSTAAVRSELLDVQAELRQKRQTLESIQAAQRAANPPLTSTFPNTTATAGPSTPSTFGNTSSSLDGPPYINSLTSTFPHSTSTPTGEAIRGRPRGRPKGSGKASMREPVTPHITPSKTALINTPTTATATSGTPSQLRNPAAGNTPNQANGNAGNRPAVNGTGTPTGDVKKPKTGTMKHKITISSIPQFIQSGLLPRDTTKPDPKIPGRVLTMVKEQNAAIAEFDVSKCTQPQLFQLIKILGLKVPGLEHLSKSPTPSAVSTPSKPSTAVVNQPTSKEDSTAAVTATPQVNGNGGGATPLVNKRTRSSTLSQSAGPPQKK